MAKPGRACAAFRLPSLVLALVLAGCGGSGSSHSGNRGQSLSGADIEQALAAQLTDRQGNPVLPSCPDERLVEGESIRCRVTFSDGSYHDFDVSVVGFDSNGAPKLKVATG